MTDCVNRTVMTELVEEAKRKAQRFDVDMATHGATLKSPAALQAAATAVVAAQAKRLVSGWQVLLSLAIYADGLQHWHGSAMLWPSGRCSTDQDWKNLGLIVALTGAPASVNEQLHDQVQTVHPNRPHHWIWFVDAKAKA